MAYPKYKKDKTKLRIMVIDTGVNPNLSQIKPYLRDYRVSEIVDEIGHGTHIAAIIANKACPGVEIIPCRGHDLDSSRLSNRCLEKAIYLGIDIINYSMGGETWNLEENQLIGRLSKLNVILVASAGNNGQDLTKTPFYPASYKFPNIIVVGSLDEQNKPLSHSNYQNNMVWELGYKVESLNQHGEYVRWTGTSQAAAIHTSKIVGQWCKTK